MSMLKLLALLLLLPLMACNATNGGVNSDVQFWRPISDPNVVMNLDQAQGKLNFDLSQCDCSIYPRNITREQYIAFQNDNQRLAETSAMMTSPDGSGGCNQNPNMIVAECMRARGWEPTTCSGRMPTAGGSPLCVSYKF